MGLATKLADMYLSLEFNCRLPDGFRVMHPFRDNAQVRETVTTFYHRFFAGPEPRRVLLGINPGRHGGGVTGIPFTDTKRLVDDCGIPFVGPTSHEPSSVFVYRMIQALGGPDAFYRRFLFFPVCPLGFLREKKPGTWVNANYYDDPQLLEAVEPFIVENLTVLCSFGVRTDHAWSLGLGPNLRHLDRLNRVHQWFGALHGLEHPRYIIQYKSAELDWYIGRYRESLGAHG